MDIGNSFQRATDSLFGFLPNILGFLIILAIGYVVARVVAAVVGRVLAKMGLDGKLRDSQAGKYVDNLVGGASPSAGIAKIVFWFIFIFFIFSAIGALRVPALTGFMNDVLAYLPNVIAAILIFVVAALIAGGAAGAVTRVMGDTPTGRVVATVVPSLVMVIAMFMILTQLRIAPQIVQIAFAATIGALALALALAFGLGGRSVAERMLEDAYRKGQEAQDQVRRDMETGRARAEEDLHRAQQSHDPDGQSSTQTYDPYSAPGSAGTGGTDGPGSTY